MFFTKHLNNRNRKSKSRTTWSSPARQIGALPELFTLAPRPAGSALEAIPCSDLPLAQAGLLPADTPVAWPSGSAAVMYSHVKLGITARENNGNCQQGNDTSVSLGGSIEQQTWSQ